MISPHRCPGFTRYDALVVVLCLGVTLVILWQLRPRGSAPPPGPTAVTTSALDQTRVLAQALILFGRENRGWFPGLDYEGKLRNSSVADRFKVLLQRDLIAPATLVHPLERVEGQTLGSGAGLSAEQYSYALPDITQPGGRRGEWRDTANDKAPAISDRQIGVDAGTGIASLSHPQPGQWWGSVAFVDGHGETRRDAVLPTTILGRAGNVNDHLFVAAGPDDALMRHIP